MGSTKSSHSPHRDGPPENDASRNAKRLAALDAAVDLFLERGFGNTSLQQVATAAEVSTATVFKYFPTKAALFGAVMARLWEVDSPTRRHVAGDSPAEKGLLLIGRDYIRLLNRDQTVALFRVIIAEAPRFPELGRELYERGKRPYLDEVEAYLSRKVDGGDLAVNDIPLAARQFLGMINDVVFWPRLLIVDLEITDKEADKVVKSAVETFLARYRRD